MSFKRLCAYRIINWSMGVEEIEFKSDISSKSGQFKGDDK